MADLIKVVVSETEALLSLEEARQHLRVDHEDDDSLITDYANAAALSALNYCDLRLVPTGAEPVFKAATLLILGDLYANREDVPADGAFPQASLNRSALALLASYRVVRI